jgi:hypothetical protein
LEPEGEDILNLLRAKRGVPQFLALPLTLATGVQVTVWDENNHPAGYANGAGGTQNSVVDTLQETTLPCPNTISFYCAIGW